MYQGQTIRWLMLSLAMLCAHSRVPNPHQSTSRPWLRPRQPLQALQNSSSTTLQFKTLPLPASSSTVICDMSTGVPRPFVPAILRRTVFTALHSLSRPGVQATQQLISQRFVWPGMRREIKAWTCMCVPCQKSKIHRHTVTPLSTFRARFDEVHIDIVGPLPPSHGNVYLLTCIDRFTHWPEAFPMPDITAETVAHTFAFGWIARFGVPTTDRGHQFESRLWARLLHIFGCKHLRTIRSPTASSSVFIGN